MPNLNYDYQYETSPRKIEPEYERKPKKTVKNKSSQKVQKSKKIESNNYNKSNKNSKKMFEVKLFFNIMFIFGIIFAIIACQALVEQKFKEKQNLQNQYDELYAKINSVQESSEDVKSIAESYGMQVKSATLIDLQKSDYIESSVDTNDEYQQEKSWFNRLIDWIKGM